PKTRNGHTEERQAKQAPGRRACAVDKLLTEPGADNDGDRDHDSDLAQDRRVRARSTRGWGCGQVTKVYWSAAPLANRALQPAAAPEIHHQTDRDEGGDGHRQPEQRERSVRNEAPVLAEEAGDDGEDEEHGGDAGEDLHYLVEPVRSGGEVRIDDVRG